MIQLVNRTGKFMRQLTDNQLSALNAVGKFCVGKMEDYVAVDTGYLQSRCEFKIVRNELWLQNDAPYAGFQEYGTYKMAAHPFFRPSTHNHVSEIKNIFAEHLGKGMG